VSLAAKYQQLIQNVPPTVKIVFVTKYADLAQTQELVALGARDIGENRVQSGRDKAEVIQDVTWHMIGPLQSNKVRQAVKTFDYIQSVENMELARHIGAEARRIGKTQKILLEVNIGREAQKHGFLPENLAFGLNIVKKFPGISIVGLMAIPPFNDDPEKSRPYFREMKKLFASCQPLEYLSLGMSADYKIAIEEGANMIRVGSVLFE
jgi:PLP dependent protein